MILNFQKIIILSENISVSESSLSGVLIVSGDEFRSYFACKTRRQTNKTLMIFFKKVSVNSRLVVETCNKTFGNKFYQVVVTGIVFAEKHKMIRLRINIMNLVKPCSRCNVHFTSDHRFYSGFFCFAIKINCAVHDTVISNSNGLLAECGCALYQFIYPACSVKKAVHTVKMKMNEITHCSLSLSGRLSV